MKKIGIIGSGIVAKTLGKGFLNHGYEVMLGTSNQEKLSEWKSQNPNGRTGTFAESAAFGDMLVVAVKGSVAKSVLAELATLMDGKSVIDTTNPIGDGEPQNGVLNFFTSLDSSLMEQLQSQFPNAHFVKAFNSIGSGFMVNPKGFDAKPSMFICGNSEDAKSEVKEILDLFGFEIEDMGKAEAARAIEPLCMLWCIPGFINNKWSHAFRLMKA